MPHAVHHGGVIFNHFVELVVPWGFFAPQPIATIAAVLTIVFQLALIVSGNLSWLNWLTIVLALAAVADSWLRWIPVRPPELADPHTIHRQLVYVLAAAAVLLSIAPTLNMLSSSQVMNTSFEPLHLVNTYGAFGSITRVRDEIVVEGTNDDAKNPLAEWREYEFRGKPGDPFRRPPQIAPYHLRLGWLMWFAAMEPAYAHAQWFDPMIVKLLQGDRATLGLLRSNPFPDGPPRYVRAELFRYTFTTPDERRRTGRWWNRTRTGTYLPPVSLQNVRAGPS
jgi:hypothetical protein